MFPKRIIIFANGDLPDLEKARALLHNDDFIIAADGGTRHTLALGLTPSIVIGDMDSLPAGFEISKFDDDVILTGLHTTRKKVQFIQRETVIPPDIINTVSQQFASVWR